MEMIFIQKQDVIKIMDHQMKKKKKDFIKNKLPNLCINQEFAKIVNNIKDLLLAFDGKSLYCSAMVDNDS